MSNKRKKCTAVDLSGNNIFLSTFPIPALPSLMFSLARCEVFDLPFETTHVRMDRSGIGNVNGALGLYS